MKITPTRGNCLIELIETQETSASGLIIPDEVKSRQAKGKVIEIGSPEYLGDGVYDLKSLVDKGDIVWFKQFAGEPIREEGKKYLIVPYKEILAVIK